MPLKELEAKLSLDAEEFTEDVQEAKEALRELEEAADDAGEALARLGLTPADGGDYVKADELEEILAERERRAVDELSGGIDL